MAAKAGPTLEEVLGDTPPEKLDQPCQDKHLCHIAREITNWVFLAPFLRVKAPEVEAIRGKWPFNVPAQNLELLIQWKQRHQRKGKDKYRNLCKAFVNAKEVTLAEKVCEVLCSQGDSSESSSDESDEEPIMPQPLRVQVTPPPDQKAEPEGPSAAGGQSTHAGSNCEVNSPDYLAHHLRMSYGCQTPSFAVLQWPPPPTFKVFNLAMIHDKEIVRRMPLDDKLIRLTLMGSVDDIMKVKSSIKLEDLFKCFHGSKDRLVILIEGAPGSGKSTLAWDICQKWKARELFHDDFKIVIYVQFRDSDVQSATKIADLLPFMPSKQKDGASTIVDCDGTGVLFVLDGWDEYSPGQRGSLFEKLICRPDKLGIPNSTVLITSRPIASGTLQPYATSRVEIVGFMSDEVGQYFKDVFEDPVTVQKLYDHLEERPTIKASCYLPLNAAIVAHLFMELNYTLPTTLHGLFCSLVLSCIIRHLTKESETQPTITSLDELPPDVQKVLVNISTLAYNGTICNKVIFSSQDLRSFGLPENLSTLSLMQVVQSFATGKPSSYHFLHLSIQELLTALHISKLPPRKQVKIFTKLFDQPRFDAVFRFYAAFSKLQTKGIRNIISTITSMSTQGERRRLLNLIHCLYEAQDTSLCYFVSSQLKGKLDLTYMILSPLDLLSMKYFLSCVNSSSSTKDSDSGSCGVTVSDINLENCKLTSEDIDSLSLCNLVTLNLTGNSVSCACAANILTNSPQLKQVFLNNCTLTNDRIEVFAAALREHPSLEDLIMYRCTDSGHVTHHILQAVLNHHRLQVLSIAGCPVDVKDIAAVLEVNGSLPDLRISGDKISERDSVILARSLRKNRTLETLVVYLTTGCIAWMEGFVWSLRDCNLKILHVYGSPRVTTRVSIQLVDRVNTIRADRGLPLLSVYFSG